MFESNLVSENETVLKEAISSGISSDTINYTLRNLIEKKDIKGTHKQISKTLMTIIYMKKRVKNSDTEKYYSSIVKNNSEKIKSALRDGITPDEIAISLIDTIHSPNKNSKKRLSFMIKLITKMKIKELSLQNNIGYQKVYNK